MPFIDTGDNEPKQRDLLLHIAIDLEKRFGCHIINPVVDGTYRRCAYHIQQGQTRAYVVARGTPEHEDHIVSTQAMLIARALNEDKPLIMWSNGYYHIFDPRRINMENYGQNDRLGVSMVNFSIQLSRIWNGEPLYQLWTQLKAATNNYSRTKLTTFLGA